MAKEMTFRGKSIVVRQLTVGEVAAFFDQTSDLAVTTADILMNRQVPARVVATACGLALDALNGDVLPSELAALWDAVEAENPFFCAAIARLLSAIGQAAGLDAQPGQAAPSEKPPASWPETAMAPA